MQLGGGKKITRATSRATITRATSRDEICNLVGARKLPEPPLVRQFNLYLDDSGLLWCRGRIQDSPLNQEAIMVLS